MLKKKQDVQGKVVILLVRIVVFLRTATVWPPLENFYQIYELEGRFKKRKSALQSENIII